MTLEINMKFTLATSDPVELLRALTKIPEGLVAIATGIPRGVILDDEGKKVGSWTLTMEEKEE